MAVAAPELATSARPRRRFTIDEYERMVEVGILRDDERVELILGEVVEMSPIGGPHLMAVTALDEVLQEQLGKSAWVMVQGPIRLPDHSEPQPDIVLARRRRYRKPPDIADVFLVIEVADTTIENDRRVKLPLYAAAGIPEAWLFDLNGARIERHTEPGPTGYQRMVDAERGQSLASTVLQVTLSIDDALEPEV